MAGAHSLGTSGSVGADALPGLVAAIGDRTAADRRDQPRRRPRRPTQVLLRRGAKPRAAFVRDVSSGGIGLMHPYLLEPGEAVLEIPVGEQPQLSVRVEISWCLPCRDGWYQSGAQLLGPADARAGSDCP